MQDKRTTATPRVQDSRKGEQKGRPHVPHLACLQHKVSPSCTGDQPGILDPCHPHRDDDKVEKEKVARQGKTRVTKPPQQSLNPLKSH